MLRLIQLFLFIETALFAMAALNHAAFLHITRPHHRAAVAETVIALILVTGLVLTQLLPRSVAKLALIFQTLAFLGTLIGLFVTAIGIGPRTIPDILFHIAVIIILVAGMLVSVRTIPSRLL